MQDDDVKFIILIIIISLFIHKNAMNSSANRTRKAHRQLFQQPQVITQYSQNLRQNTANIHNNTH